MSTQKYSGDRLEAAMKPSLIGQQAFFMNLCRQKRFSLLQTLNGIKDHDKEFIIATIMAIDLINEEWNKETLPVIQDLIGGTADKRASEEIIVDQLVHIADGMIDTIYVCASFLNMFGFPGDQVWDIVQDRNVAKAEDCPKCGGVGGFADQAACGQCEGTGKVIVRRADGKILKPDTWYPPEPEIKKLLLQKLKELDDARQSANPDWP